MIKKRVVMVDDSVLARAVLREILEEDGDIEIIGEAQNAYEAVGVVDALRPDLVTMDIDMPGPSGLDAISWLMEKSPVPILVVTSEKLGGPSAIGFQAIQRGALDFTPKPSVTDGDATRRIRELARTLASVPVFAHAETQAAKAAQNDDFVMPDEPTSHAEVVAIAAGLGGPRAVSSVVERLTRDFPCSLVIMQQMPATFAEGFVRFLRALTPMPVHLVERGPCTMRRGEIYVCNGGSQLLCSKVGELSTEVTSERPRADLLMSDLAAAYGARAVGVVVSGSGHDGAEGLRKMRDAGALTIIERPETARPNDMPKAAATAGAASRVIPAELIADFLLGTLTTRSASTTAPPPGLKTTPP